jgi:hypothetical protein
MSHDDRSGEGAAQLREVGAPVVPQSVE